MDEALTLYMCAHSDPESDYLHRLWRAANLHFVNGRMAVGHLQGRLLRMIVHMVKPKNILEVGTFSGYSAICMAEGLDDEGMVWTFEKNDEQEDFARQWIDGSTVANKIRLIIGDAITEAPRLGITFDMAYLDGDKRTYTETYNAVIPLIKQGGFILADNTLWDGHITDPSYARDAMTRGIREFNDTVANDTRVERVMLPLRDGLTIIRKK